MSLIVATSEKSSKFWCVFRLLSIKGCDKAKLPEYIDTVYYSVPLIRPRQTRSVISRNLSTSLCKYVSSSAVIS